ncbi:hypothetical protein [Phage silverpheasant213]|nr:hypothetical protein [Phage silverpheasant213]
MGIYSRYTTAFLISLAAFAAASNVHAATLHPVPGIAKALAAGPSGVMPSGLTVQRSQQLGVMLLKSQVNLSLGGGTLVPVTRGASLSVGGLARGAVTVLKNSSPPKLIGSVVIAGALAAIPGAKVHEGELIKASEPDPVPVTNGQIFYYQMTGVPGRHATAEAVCREYAKTLNGHVYDGNTGHYSNGGCYTKYGGVRYSSSRDYVRVTEQCSLGYMSAGRHCSDGTVPMVPFSPADFDALEGAIPASDPSPDDVRDFWFDICSGNGACMGSYTSEPTLSGPSSVQGPQTTTTSTGPNGTTTTTTDVQHDLDYSNPDGVAVRDRTTTTTTDPDGNITTDTTVDTGPLSVANPEEQPDFDLDGSFSDTPFPEVEPFYQQKYPDGLQGAWNARKAEFEDSAFMDFLSSFIPSFSGSCPGWSMNINIASWASFGIHEFQSLCWVFDFIKVVLLVSAAFLCRALIFGG